MSLRSFLHLLINSSNTFHKITCISWIHIHFLCKKKKSFGKSVTLQERLCSLLLKKGKYNPSHFLLLLAQVTINHNNGITMIWFYYTHSLQIKPFNFCFDVNGLIKYVWSYKCFDFFKNKSNLNSSYCFIMNFQDICPFPTHPNLLKKNHQCSTRICQ